MSALTHLHSLSECHRTRSLMSPADPSPLCHQKPAGGVPVYSQLDESGDSDRKKGGRPVTFFLPRMTYVKNVTHRKRIPTGFFGI